MKSSQLYEAHTEQLTLVKEMVKIIVTFTTSQSPYCLFPGFGSRITELSIAKPIRTVYRLYQGFFFSQWIISSNTVTT